MPRTPFDDLDDGHVLTPQDIAERLRVDPRSVRRAIARGELAASNTYGLRVLACDASAWWRAKTVKATTPGATADPPPADAGRVRVVVEGRRARQGPPRTLSREQIASLTAQLDSRDRLLVLLLRWTGLRIAEALGLRWEDLDRTDDGLVLHVRRQWQDGRLVDHAKTHAGIRAVAVVPTLERALDEARREAVFDGPGDPIFATRRGTHRDSHNLRRRLRPAVRAAGVPRATPHVLRHSLATELLDHDYDINAVANVLGHRSAAFTRRTYIHVRETPRFDGLDVEEKGSRLAG